MNAPLLILDGFLLVVLAARLVALKRTVDRYRPPSPLPAEKRLTWDGLTITRVS